VGVQVFNAGLLEIGESIGHATVAHYLQTRLGTLELEIDGTIPGDEYDQLFVTGNVDLSTPGTAGGALDIPVNDNGGSYVDPAEPGDHDIFHFINAATLSGSFGAVVYDGTSLAPSFVGPGYFRSYQGGGLFRIVEYDEDGLALINYRALPGDANGDLTVDVSDFNIWNANKFKSGTDWLTGDFNGDGSTDVSDFNIWNAHKFTVAEDFSLIPEPTAVLLLYLAVIAVILPIRKGTPS
jgi:hypothetical protein